MKVYIDSDGREHSEESILRDFLGRNRERALQLLGETRDDPRGGRPRWGIRVDPMENGPGVRITRPMALPQTD